MEFTWQEHWSELPFPTPEDLPDPGTEPTSPCIVFFTAEPPGKPQPLLGWGKGDQADLPISQASFSSSKILCKNDDGKRELL